ncbi:MAG TPA: DUF1631 family protein [Casimicrobiaceae bacterium]
MAADATSDGAPPERLVVEVQGSREVGPVEAEGLLRECLALTHKRLDAAIWRALQRLQGAAGEDDEDPTDATATAPDAALLTPQARTLDERIARAVLEQRSEFIPRFRAAFHQAFQRRREGKPRPRTQGDKSAQLAIVDYGDHSAQIALKGAVKAMREATLEEAFALDFRVRLILRQPPAPAGTFDNPWSADYICDAFGSACRELWPKDGLWRSIMERLVRATTPQVAALHRELNVLLQDRDVLPMLRVRTRARSGAPIPQETDSHALFERLVQLLGASASAQPTASFARVGAPAPGGVAPGRLGAGPGSMWPAAGATTRSGRAWAASAEEWARQQNTLLWSALVAALGSLQRGQPLAPGLPELSGIDREALRSGSANELPALRAAFEGKTGSPAARASIDVVAGVLESVFDDRYLPDEIKAVFGRLQIPLLRAALLDPRLVSQPRHPARRFFDSLAQASVDLQPGTERGRALIELARSLAEEIRDDFDGDPAIFDAALSELDAFLDAERAEVNARLAEAVPPLIAQDERADARAEAQAAIDARLAGRPVPPEIRAFLDHECVGRLSAICLKDGPEGYAWEGELAMIEELLWSITPKTSNAARKKLASLLPALLKRIDRDWSPENDAQARRQALMACLFDLHVRSLKAAAEPAGAAPAAPAPAVATMATLAAIAPPPAEPDEHDEQVFSLVRGDWVEFRSESEPVLARLAWRAPQRRRLLFTHRDGTTAFVHTPESLTEAFRNGHAVLAIEAVPLFDRAMARLVTRRSRQSAAATA